MLRDQQVDESCEALEWIERLYHCITEVSLTGKRGPSAVRRQCGDFAAQTTSNLDQLDLNYPVLSKRAYY